MSKPNETQLSATDADISKFEKELQIKPLPTAPDSFTNASPLWVVNGTRGIAGSLFLAHSTAAAYRTVPNDFTVHSLQSHFFAAGDLKLPIMYAVERVQSGKTFAVRVVKATQGAAHLASITLSFMRKQQADFPALGHAMAPVPDTKPPDEATDDVKYFRTKKGPWAQAQRAQITGSALHPSTRTALHWLRALTTPLSSPHAHHIALMYLSDFYILNAAMRIFDLHVGLPVPGDPIQSPDQRPDLDYMVTLDHSVHVYDLEGFRADQWMKVEIESPWARDGRTMSRSRIFTRDGRLVASCEQEGFVKLRKGVKEGLEGGGKREGGKL